MNVFDVTAEMIGSGEKKGNVNVSLEQRFWVMRDQTKCQWDPGVRCPGIQKAPQRQVQVQMGQLFSQE
ncbi:hypothetical protein SKAU_G00084360 [Synaphobranchus kaupii]|uniref:Uncharacterized protein n=1 Tax=Synaphobranchus kaupii TaxID=118154 RepID=A0A9Q1FVB8_SYNKA|nr:hypothetical protein SKAU_G00084360 [Synaphobranchus kaupii]